MAVNGVYHDQMLRVAAANFRVVSDLRNNLDRAAALAAQAADRRAGLFVSLASLLIEYCAAMSLRVL